MSCEFCAALSGRFHAKRECCQLRQLVGMPAHVRMAAYDRVLREDGKEALAELKRKLRAELQRQLGITAAAKADRDALAGAAGRAAAAMLLKKIKDEKLDVPPLERRAGPHQQTEMREFA